MLVSLTVIFPPWKPSWFAGPVAVDGAGDGAAQPNSKAVIATKITRTRFWLPWLLLASYVLYGWWNPWYLILVAYSTVLDYLLVALMDHSREERGGRFHDPFLRGAFVISVSLLTMLIGAALVLPATLRPTLLAFALLVLLMAVGSLLASRRIWLLISLFNNLALLLFFKYARFVAENLNQVLAALGTLAAELRRRHPGLRAEVHEYHGGWLVLDH